MIRTHHWIIMFVVAIALHLLVFIGLAHSKTEGAKDKGELGIEIDLGMLGDLGEAQETVEVTAVEPPPAPEPEPEVEPEPEPEPEPPKQKPVVKVKPKPEKPKKVVKKQPPREVKPEPKPSTNDAVVTDSPPSDQKTNSTVAQRKASTGIGQSRTTGGNPGALQSYNALLQAKLAKYKRYPIASRRRGEEGEVRLHFVVDRSGKVLEHSIKGSSGSKRLDDAVLKMLKKAQPFPPFPDEITASQMSYNIPVGFYLKDLR
ncbi:energy transducer TonB [Neptunomonas phycophila]|uniref:energy transducer TonB n=1 Tax=Neptunomonas phycophila TaxID=1572645 RepID=UPI0026E469DC|nr:energy transducer TonB [Neptunomonas phycophila]MDO6784697.1 energy transducer TonB [Neptunomonas phycophila]